MKKLFRIFVFAVIINFTYGCSETKQKTRSEIYSEKTAELINDLLKDEGNHICDCILEPNNSSMAEIYKSEVPAFEFEDYIVKKLSLKNVAEIDSLYGFKEKLTLNLDLITQAIKVISNREYDSINRKYDSLFIKYEYDKALEIFINTYPNICSFNKPIFDKNLKNGLFWISSGSTCLWTPPPKVKNVQGVWEYDWN
jgi:hypothetical protein